MKLLIIIFQILFVSVASYAQKIEILEIIHGPAKIKGADSALKTGDIISLEDQIAMGARCEIACQVKGKGIFRISLRNDPRRSLTPASFLFQVKSLFLPVKKNAILGYRGNEIINNLSGLKSHFSGYDSDSTRLLIIDEYRFAINSEQLRLNKDTFLFVGYHYNGKFLQKPVSSVPSTDNGKILLLNLDQNVFMLGGKRIDESRMKDFGLYIYYSGTDKSYPVTSFRVSYLNYGEIKPILQLIPTINAKLDYLLNFHGNIHSSRLEEILRTN